MEHVRNPYFMGISYTLPCESDRCDRQTPTGVVTIELAEEAKKLIKSCPDMVGCGDTIGTSALKP
jgi:hypothetical protein